MAVTLRLTRLSVDIHALGRASYLSSSFSLVLILLRQAVPQQKAALATMAAFAASVLLSAAPAQADVKSTVCAHNATARICLKDSAKK
jgi:hypothetical protein